MECPLVKLSDIYWNALRHLAVAAIWSKWGNYYLTEGVFQALFLPTLISLPYP